MSATVLSASSTSCPYGVSSETVNMAGYTGFTGFTPKGKNVSLKEWVIGISPGKPEFTKWGYDLKQATTLGGATATFKGAAVYGGQSSEFSGTTGTYTLIINPTTLAATLTVTDTKCIISYSLTFTRSIPTKFLNLL